MKSPKITAKKVLVVEDEPSIRGICQRVLSGKGFEVDLADNGKSAQALINQKEYDFFLVDIRTPAMNGIEFYMWLKSVKPHLAQRVIFTTGDLMRDDIRSFLEKTRRPYLPKPFTPGELLAAVNKAVEAT